MVFQNLELTQKFKLRVAAPYGLTTPTTDFPTFILTHLPQLFQLSKEFLAAWQERLAVIWQASLVRTNTGDGVANDMPAALVMIWMNGITAN
ncbi:MAG: hypothetical protein U0401_05635 [Anaerolineae bacterium]